MAIERRKAPVPKGKLGKWLRWRSEIYHQVQDVVVSKYIYQEMWRIIEKNPALRQGNSFIDFMVNSYVSHAMMGLRRQLKVDDKSISLAGLLSDMSQHPRELSRAYFTSLYAGSAVDFLADSHFDPYADASGRHLDPAIPETDLRELQAATQRCERFADRRVAHFDRRGPGKLPTFDDLAHCIDLLDRLFVKYHLLLLAEGMQTTLPTWQYAWQEIFRLPWLQSDEDQP